MTALRVVAPGDRPARKRLPATLVKAVESGTRTDVLEVMRRRIAQAMDDPNIRGADLASLSRRLLEIGRELGAVEHEPDPQSTPPEDGPFDPAAI